MYMLQNLRNTSLLRGQSVALQVVDAPMQSWASPADVMATAFQMEVDVTASLQQLYSMAETSKRHAYHSIS